MTDFRIPKSVSDVRPLRLADLPNVIHSKELAFEKDPLGHWIRDTEDFHNSPLYIQGRRTESYAVWTHFATKGWGFTVGDGDAGVGYLPAKKTWSPVDRGVNSTLNRIYSLGYIFTFTSQQKKRGKEFVEKSKQAMKEALGSRVDDMVCLHTLYTKPAKQGRGYASALVQEVTKIADEQQRATFLFSSNIANTGFYNSVGFVEKGRFVLGEDDPTWKEDPVIVLVMVREFSDFI